MTDVGALLADPSRIGALSPQEAHRLLVQLSAILLALAARVGAAAQDAPTPSEINSDLELRHLTPRHVAGLLSETEGRVRQMCRAGTLPATKFGKGWRIPEAALRAWLAGQTTGMDNGLSAPYSPRHARSRGAVAQKGSGAHAHDASALGAGRLARLRAGSPRPPVPRRD
jgi:excisionase family DNA binding protein